MTGYVYRRAVGVEPAGCFCWFDTDPGAVFLAYQESATMVTAVELSIIEWYVLSQLWLASFCEPIALFATLERIRASRERSLPPGMSEGV